MVYPRWIRQYGTSSIETYLGHRPNPTVFKVPCSIQVENKSVDEFSNYQLKYKNHELFYKFNEPKKPNNNPDEKPSSPSYIKGMDKLAFMSLRPNHKIPAIAQGRFFALRFFPRQHYLSLFRKSNIAYAFSNKGGFKLNDVNLQEKLDKYSGKYHNDPMFSKSIKPLDTAFGRHRFRWYVKRLLYDTIRDVVPQDKVHTVEGIFQFQFGVVPTTSKDRHEIRQLIKDGVLKIMHNKDYKRKLLTICKKQNNPKNVKQLKQQVIATNKQDLSVESVAEKLPFINDEKWLI